MAETALAKTDTEKNIYESLAMRGDISALNPQDKAAYLQKLCESLGLNPFTQPFIPLKLNNKEILYASRGATDQLSSINKLTREIVKTERLEDVYIVTCKVTAPDGRFEIGTGAVTLGTLKGDALANALMKAETKAKRRATLSFCGLGFLDESELETIKPEQPRPTTKGELIDDYRRTPYEVETEEKMFKSDAENVELILENFPPEVQSLAMQLDELYKLQGFENNSKVLEKFFQLPTFEEMENAVSTVRQKTEEKLREQVKAAINSDDFPYNAERTVEYLSDLGITKIDEAEIPALKKALDQMREDSII